MDSCCGRDFNNRTSYMYHEHYKHQMYPKQEVKTFMCSRCTRKFPWEISLVQHETFNQHRPKPPRKRKNQSGRKKQKAAKELLSLTATLSEYYTRDVVVAPNDRKESKAKVYIIVRKLLKEVQDTENGGEIYSSEIRNAGSTATGTKVNVADEFDFDIPLNVDKFSIIEPSIPDLSYKGVVVEYTKSKIQHLTDKDGHLNPTKILNDIHKRIGKANENLIEGKKADIKCRTTKDNATCEDTEPSLSVILQKRPHGPAVTLTITVTYDKTSHKHHIDVDVSPWLPVPSNIVVSSAVYVRLNKVFARKPYVMTEMEQTPLILVPKKTNDWLVSYSKQMKLFINKVDGAGECRKECHKILKYDVKKMISKEAFPGISTYIFKHHLLWFCEKTCGNDTQYWKSENLGRCYTDMLEDLTKKISDGEVLNYFNDVNILDGKDMKVMKRFAQRLRERRNQLLRTNS